MIRTAEKRDAEEIERLAQSEESDAPPLAVLESLLECYPALVSEEGGKMVGFWVTQSLGGDILLVRDFAVSREERFHRYGRKLMRELQDRARGAGYKTLVISLHHPRPASEDFLERSGWGVIYETGDTRLFSKSLL